MRCSEEGTDMTWIARLIGRRSPAEGPTAFDIRLSRLSAEGGTRRTNRVGLFRRPG